MLKVERQRNNGKNRKKDKNQKLLFSVQMANLFPFWALQLQLQLLCNLLSGRSTVLGTVYSIALPVMFNNFECIAKFNILNELIYMSMMTKNYNNTILANTPADSSGWWNDLSHLSKKIPMVSFLYQE